MMNLTAQNIKGTSVILEPDVSNPDMMLPYHCWRCGDIVGQFKGGDVLFIVPGGQELIIPTWIVFCRKCKQRFFVQSKL